MENSPFPNPLKEVKVRIFLDFLNIFLDFF
jgi:hypothetical protein